MMSSSSSSDVASSMVASGEEAVGEAEEGPGFRLVLGAPVAMSTGSIGAFGAVVACEEGISGLRHDLPGIATSAVIPKWTECTL